MYNNLLQTVIRTVNTAVKPDAYEELDATYDMMFHRERYTEYRERARQKIEMGNKVIIGATGLAVAGELIHLVKKSGIIGKILKR